jgi:hypothetical protein
MLVRVTASVTLLVASLATCDRRGESASSASADGAAPSASTTGGRRGSCDRVAATSVCSEYSGSWLSQNEAMITSGCTKNKGTFVYAECPNTSLVGSCTLATGEIRRYYASGGAPYDVDRAKMECATAYRGTWAL